MEAYPDVNDKDVIDSVFGMANILFSMAEQFGYKEIIEKNIYEFHKNKV